MVPKIASFLGSIQNEGNVMYAVAAVVSATVPLVHPRPLLPAPDRLRSDRRRRQRIAHGPDPPVNVSKRWGSYVGVDNFSLDIADAEFLVLLGPSGCGKTTTMRMIAGLEDVTEGEIWIGDRMVNRLEPKDRDISMVFQSYGLYPNLTVYENIRFPLRVRRIPAAEHHDRVMKAAAMVELGPFLDRRPAALSGGQRQRVALARAIVREPNAFLMDEPLSNLDAKLRVSTRAQIKHLHHTLRRTTIYVTHDQIEAMTLADRVVVMNHGLVQQLGTPTEIYDRPANTFVASFIGSPAMNLIDGRDHRRHLPRRGHRGPRPARPWPGHPGLPRRRCPRRARTAASSPRPSTRWSFWATPRSFPSASARHWSRSAPRKTSASTSARPSMSRSRRPPSTSSTQKTGTRLA